MRVVFMGTPSFAVPSLDVLIRDHDVAAVYTRPDAASGRGRRVVFSPVKERALEAGLRLEQPVSLRDEHSAEQLARYAPEIVVVAAYGLILPRAVLDIPVHGCLNVHASLLPRWRGAAPVERAILCGDAETGVSIMRMEEGLDTGPFALQAPVAVGDRTADSLTADLARAGASALAAVLDTPPGRLAWTSQDDAAATYADKVRAGDVAIDPALTVADALRRVRASSRRAPARARIAGRLVVIARASVAEDADASLAPSDASCSRELVLGLSDGALRVDELVPEGRGAMSGADWVRGARLECTCTWSAP